MNENEVHKMTQEDLGYWIPNPRNPSTFTLVSKAEYEEYNKIYSEIEKDKAFYQHIHEVLLGFVALVFGGGAAILYSKSWPFLLQFWSGFFAAFLFCATLVVLGILYKVTKDS